MRHLRESLEIAIRELGTRDTAVVGRLLETIETIDKMADALRPAARQAVTPVGDAAETLAIDGPSMTKPKQEDPNQSRRFIEMARERGK